MRKNKHSTALKGHSLYLPLQRMNTWIHGLMVLEETCCPFLAIIFSFRVHLFAFFASHFTTTNRQNAMYFEHSSLSLFALEWNFCSFIAVFYTVPSAFAGKTISDCIHTLTHKCQCQFNYSPAQCIHYNIARQPIHN